MRRPKTTRVPRTRAGGEWTEAAFWSFIRSGLRQQSMRWPPIVRQALLSVRRPYVLPPGKKKTRRKWEYQCAICREFWFRDQVQVDHIVPCGELKSWDDVSIFAERLFCELKGLRVLCTKCHKSITKEARR